MKSRSSLHRRSRWAHANTPAALQRRKAEADAQREAIAATMPPAFTPPAPGSHWQRIIIDVYVPPRGRCDQHQAEIDGEPIGLLSATEIGRRAAATIRKRPSVELQAEIRREEWREGLRAYVDGRA